MKSLHPIVMAVAPASPRLVATEAAGRDVLAVSLGEADATAQPQAPMSRTQQVQWLLGSDKSETANGGRC